MENKFVAVKSLTLTIGEQEIVVTPDEAKRLCEVLNGLFEREIIVRKEIISPVYPDPIYPYNPWWWRPTIYCSDTTSKMTFGCVDDTIKCKVNIIE